MLQATDSLLKELTETVISLLLELQYTVTSSKTSKLLVIWKYFECEY